MGGLIAIRHLLFFSSIFAMAKWRKWQKTAILVILAIDFLAIYFFFPKIGGENGDEPPPPVYFYVFYVICHCYQNVLPKRVRVTKKKVALLTI